jgi:hypothetical protein
MIYRNCKYDQLDTFLYILYYFNVFLFENCVYFFKGKFQSSQLQNVFMDEEKLKKCIMFSYSKTIFFFFIDQNNRDYDFFHNGAALQLISFRLHLLSSSSAGSKYGQRCW